MSSPEHGSGLFLYPVIHISGLYKFLHKSCYAAFIPGVSKLNLSDILAVIRELRAVLPAQLEHEGLPPIQVNVVARCQIVPNRPDEE